MTVSAASAVRYSAHDPGIPVLACVRRFIVYAGYSVISLLPCQVLYAGVLRSV